MLVVGVDAALAAAARHLTRRHAHIVLHHCHSSGTSSTSTTKPQATQTLSANSPLRPLPSPSPIIKIIQTRISLSAPPINSPSSPSEADIFRTNTDLLCKALQLGDVHAACTLWSALAERGLVRYLGPIELGAYSRLLSSIWTQPQHWVQQTSAWKDAASQRIMEDITLTAAARGIFHALGTLFMCLIKRGNSEAIPRLYKMYMTLLEAPIAQLDSPNLDEFALAELSRPQSDVLRSHHEQRILLYVITAHAIQGDFQQALHTILTSPIQFDPTSVPSFLRSLNYDPNLQQTANMYIRHLGIAKTISQPLALFNRITSLGQSISAELERFYDTVIAGLTSSDGYIVANPAQVSVSRPVLMPEIGWVAFLGAFFANHRKDLVATLWRHLDRLGVPVTLRIWTALFEGYESIRAADELLSGWDAMLKQGLQPDAIAHRIVISTLFKSKRQQEAMDWFATFKKARTTAVFDESQVLLVYNTVIERLLWYGNLLGANTILQTMEQEGVKPDVVTFNTFLASHGRAGDFKGVAAMLRALKQRGLVADVVTWSTVLSALLKTGRTDVGETLLQLMRRHGIEPNVVTYGTIIDHLVRTPDEKYLEAAFQVLRRMEEDHSVQPNLVTYTTFLSGIYARRWIDQHAADECANYISQQLKRRRIPLDRPAYNTLLQASLDNESQEGLSKALNLYREMVARGVVLGNDTWYVLLDGLSRREEWDIAGELVRCIDKSPSFHMSPGLRRLVEAVRTRTEHQLNPQRGVS